MAKKKKNIPQYGTVTRKGVLYYRTRILDADGKQSMEIKRTQKDISSLEKQLSELRGLFKGKERKSLEGKIELLEDLEKRLHKSMEQIVKREGYPNVQDFQKVYNKAEALIVIRQIKRCLLRQIKTGFTEHLTMV